MSQPSPKPKAVSPSRVRKQQATAAGGAPAAESQETPFGFHAYDLSMGFAAHYAELACGEALPAVYHSALVIFGFEYFFEGGVAQCPAGTTRFGDRYRYLRDEAHVTTRTREEFERWCDAVSATHFGPLQYDIVDHNCHHFCDAAAHFLTRGRVGCSQEILCNLETLVRSPIGLAVAPVLQRLAGGFSHELANVNIEHRQAASTARNMALYAANTAGFERPPPLLAFSYPRPPPHAPADVVAEVASAINAAAFAAVHRSSHRPAGHTPAPPPAAEVAAMIRAAAGRVRDEGSRAEVSVLEAQLLCEAIGEQLGPARCYSFSALHHGLCFWHMLATHDVVCQAAARSQLLLLLFDRLAFHFVALLPTATRTALAQLVATLLAHPATSALLRARVDSIVTLVGVCMATPDWLTVDAAAAVAHNALVGHRILTRRGLATDIASVGDKHSSCRLVTLLHHGLRHTLPGLRELRAQPLYHERPNIGPLERQAALRNAGYTTDVAADELDRLVERHQRVAHKLLCGLLQFVVAGETSEWFSASHPIELDFTALGARVETPENRALYKMLEAVFASLESPHGTTTAGASPLPPEDPCHAAIYDIYDSQPPHDAAPS